MTSPEVHTLAGAYALDALPAEEVDDFEAHLAACATCRDEVASFAATTARLSELAEDAPPPQVKPDVMAMITSVRQDPPPAKGDDGDDPDVPAAPIADPSADLVTATAPGRDTANQRAASPPTIPPPANAHDRESTRAGGLANRLGLGLAAALLVVAGALGLWASSLNGQLQERDEQAQQVAAVLASDGARTIQANGTTLVVSSDDRAVLASTGLGAPGVDEVLQVWVIDERGAVSAGLFEDPASPELLDVPVPAGTTVGITIEPAGGSDQPTSDPIWAADV